MEKNNNGRISTSEDYLLEEQDDYVDKDEIDLDKGLTLPVSDYGYDSSEDIDEDEFSEEELKEEFEEEENEIDSDSLVYGSTNSQTNVVKETKNNINNDIKTNINTTNTSVNTPKESVPSSDSSKAFTPFKEDIYSGNKEKKGGFASFVEDVTGPSSNKDKKHSVFTPFKETFDSPAPKVKKEEVVKTQNNSVIQAEKENNEVVVGEEVLDKNNLTSDSELSNLFKKKMLEVIFGTNDNQIEKEEKVDANDEPDIELDYVPGTSSQKRSKKRIKIVEQTNLTYASGGSGIPKCLPKGFRNTKYSKKTVGLMRIDFSSYISLLLFAAIAGIAYFSYYIFSYSFEPYLRILDLSWLNVYTFTIIPFAVGFFVSILLHDIVKHIFAFYSGYRVLYFRVLGFTFYHYGKGTKKIGFSFKHLFNFRHEYIPKKGNLKKNPLIMNLFSGLGQLIFFAILWIRYSNFVKATDSRYLFWADQPQTVLLWITFFTFLYALIPFIYQILPLKMRSHSDAFNFFQLLGKNDRMCFNICAINTLKEATGEDFTISEVSCNIQNYFQFYAYYYTYLSRLYSEDYKNARKDLHYLKLLDTIPDKKDRYIVDFERSYIRYLYSDPADAEVVFSKAKKGSRIALRPKRLADYRVSIELCANILQESKRIIRFVEKLNTFLPFYPKRGKRIMKEYQFISYSLKNVQTLIPNINLPELSFLDSNRRV